MDFDVLIRVLRAFEAGGVSYAVFGAVALNLHGFAADLETECVPVEDFHVTVVTPSMLYRMKDAEVLRRRFGFTDGKKEP